MYSEGLHILFVELSKKTQQFLNVIDSAAQYNQFELELMNECLWLIDELLNGMEIENAEHEGCIFDKEILERYGLFR